MEYFVDTNIFLRLFVKEDEKSFKECYQFFKLMEGRKIRAFTSPLVLVEIDWVLESFYKFQKDKAIEALESISKLRGLQLIDKINFPLAIELYKNQKVKFLDALIASNPKVIRREIAIVSYDKDFDKLGVIRKEPKEITLTNKTEKKRQGED